MSSTNATTTATITSGSHDLAGQALTRRTALGFCRVISAVLAVLAALDK